MKYGLIGEKLGHSFSREIHMRLANYDYELCEIARDRLDGFMCRRDFAAINVTIPYKQAVMPYLDCIDSAAERIGAVNTVVNRDGVLYGYNTDFAGMKALILHCGVQIDGARVLVLGSGGTSHTALAVCESMRAASVHRVSRTGRDGCITYDDAYRMGADVIINTTPCGMYPNVGGMPVDLDRLGGVRGVVDAVYNPLRTALICNARARGITAEGGLYMLVAQAAAAVKHFIGRDVDADRIERVYRQLMNENQNIVLVGMPSSGKSTVGRALAERMGRRFIDTDDEIVARTGRSITDIFEHEGEGAFRDIESEVIAQLAPIRGAVIATGGGAVLRGQNLLCLRQNGRIYYIDRPLEQLTGTPDRPLARDTDALRRRYEERHDIYLAAADCVIPSTTVERNADSIAEEFLK